MFICISIREVYIYLHMYLWALRFTIVNLGQVIYRVRSLFFVRNPYNPYMISCTDFRKSVHKIRTSVHKIRTSGFKSVHMLFKFYLFFTCHSCIWKVMSLEPYIFSQYIGILHSNFWRKKHWYNFRFNKKDMRFVLIRNLS